MPIGTLGPDVPEDDVINFSWVVPQRLAGMAKPGAFSNSLEQDLTILEARGIRMIVTLTEDALPAEDLGLHGIEAVHIPVVDYTAPTQDQLLEFVRVAGEAMHDGRPVATHCFAGKGRTGTVLAAWLVSTGRSGSDAIDAIRAARPGSIETEEQEQAVIDFETTWAQRIP
jgi:atypical dual specificity phosphatase